MPAFRVILENGQVYPSVQSRNEEDAERAAQNMEECFGRGRPAVTFVGPLFGPFPVESPEEYYASRVTGNPYASAKSRKGKK